MNLKLNKTYHGFKFLEEKFVKEINSQVRLLQHEKSGARLLAINNDDDNKAFSVSFRTPPHNSTGLPHILEHSVLCGSRKFPLKDPFVQLAKGSLNTFLNAMTFPDKTMYPIASTNEKDFLNLMDVYLDAVFYPNIYNRKEILMQEGWHHELEDKAGELSYKGVVYNEMKGALSSPESLLYRKIQESLFPDSPYGYESGGEPEVIPELSQEEFLAFHTKYYHPSNSFIFLYGDGVLEEQLKFIDESYLKDFDAKEIDSKIPRQPAFAELRDFTAEYPIMPDEDEKDKAFFSLNFVVGESINAELYLAFEILEYLLLETPAAPLKKALLDADLGQDVFGVYDNSILQPTFSVVVKNSSLDLKDKFKEVVYDTLRGLVSNGIDKSLIEAAINRKEFDLREADYHGFSKGLLYAIKSMDSWLYGARPTMHLEYEQNLSKIKSALTTNYFEELITKYLLDNTHVSFLTLKPNRSMAEEKAKKVTQELAEFKAKLTDAELEDLVKQTRDLQESQNTPDTPQELEMIPLISLDDINRGAQPLLFIEKEAAGVKVLAHPIFTNQIAYVNLYFDLKVVPQELLPYAGLLVNVLSKVSTGNYSYADLANFTNIHTGGINFTNEIFAENASTENYNARLSVKGKSLVDKVTKLFEILHEILLKTKYDEQSRLKEVILETKSRLEMAIGEQGHIIAKNRLLSYFSPRVKVLEQVSGLAYYKFIASLAKNIDSKYDEITANLAKVAKLIFNKNNILISITCEEKHYQQVADHLPLFVQGLGQEQQQISAYQFAYGSDNEGLMTPAKVQFVAKAYNLLKLGTNYTGKMAVLKTILSLDYLWNKVRVQGGAYGCIVGLERSGDMFFCSYRDPNLSKTFEVFNKVDDYLKDFHISNREMTKYIIGTISKLDFPLTPSMKGERAVAHYLGKVSQADLQKEREDILSCKQKDIQSLADVLREAMAQDYYCVLGNEAKIKEEKDLFKNLVTVFE